MSKINVKQKLLQEKKSIDVLNLKKSAFVK